MPESRAAFKSSQEAKVEKAVKREFPMRITFGEVMATTTPGFEDTKEIVAQKEVLNHLAFMVNAGSGKVAYVYPDSNGNGELTPDELLGIINNPAMEGRWPEGKKEELTAMLEPQNPSPLVTMDKTAQPFLNVRNALPRISEQYTYDKNSRKAGQSVFINLSVNKAITSADTGNRYLSYDTNNNGIVTLGELKEIYTHPDIQGHLSNYDRTTLALDIAKEAGNLTTKQWAFYCTAMEAPTLNSSPEVIKENDVFRATGKFSDDKQKILDEAIQLSLNNRSKDNKEYFSLNQYIKMSPNTYTIPSSPDPVKPEEYSESYKSVFHSMKAAAAATPASSPVAPAAKEVSAKAPLSLVEGETVEGLMARKAYQDATVIPAGGKFICLDRDDNGVLEWQEVLDNLTTNFNGRRLGTQLPEQVKEHLITMANNQQALPASRERLTEIMSTTVFEVKEGAANTELLKVLDVDGNKKVSIGEINLRQKQPVGDAKTAQAK